jgi:hypothetical protein
MNLSHLRQWAVGVTPVVDRRRDDPALMFVDLVGHPIGSAASRPDSDPMRARQQHSCDEVDDGRCNRLGNSSAIVR